MKNILILSLVCMVASVCCYAASASKPYTCQDLRVGLANYNVVQQGTKISEDDTVNALAALSYLRGYLDALYLGDGFKGNICLPTNLAYGDASTSVARHIYDAEEMVGKAGYAKDCQPGLLVGVALKQLYPCPGK